MGELFRSTSFVGESIHPRNRLLIPLFPFFLVMKFVFIRIAVSRGWECRGNTNVAILIGTCFIIPSFHALSENRFCT